MTDNLTETQETAIDLIDQIESTLATLDLMVAQARDNIDISTDLDINLLTRVLDKLERTEDAWSQAIQIIDAKQQMADAHDLADTQAGALDVAVQ